MGLFLSSLDFDYQPFHKDLLVACRSCLDAMESSHGADYEGDLKRLNGQLTAVLHKLEAAVYLPKAESEMDSRELAEINAGLEKFNKFSNAQMFSMRKIVDYLLEANGQFGAMAENNLSSDEMKGNSEVLQQMHEIIDRAVASYTQTLTNAKFCNRILRKRSYSLRKMLLKSAHRAIEGATIRFVIANKDKLMQQLDQILCKEISAGTLSGKNIVNARLFLQRITSFYSDSECSWASIAAKNQGIADIDTVLTTSKDAVASEVDRLVRLVQVLYSHHPHSAKYLTDLQNNSIVFDINEMSIIQPNIGSDPEMLLARDILLKADDSSPEKLNKNSAMEHTISSTAATSLDSEMSDASTASKKRKHKDPSKKKKKKTSADNDEESVAEHNGSKDQTQDMMSESDADSTSRPKRHRQSGNIRTTIQGNQY